MRVLLTNDDGFDAEGIKLLKEIASDIASEIWVVAPHQDRSGSGRSITLRTPIQITKIVEREFSVEGTPAECVVIASNFLMKDKMPDLILSGINSGSNIGADVSCSGTVGAALEGALLNIPSIALSQRYSNKKLPTNWTIAKKFSLPIIKRLLQMKSWPSNVVMNINFPDCEKLQGVKLIRQGTHKDSNDLSFTDQGNGKMSCMILGSRVANGDGSVSAVQDGFIAVTPLKTDLTDYSLLNSPIEMQFNSVFSDLKICE